MRGMSPIRTLAKADSEKLLVILNNSLLAAGLFLQIALLFFLVRRRMASELRLFTVLIAFYAARSMVLLAIFHQVPRDVYASLYSALSIIDLILQIAVALEISLAILRSGSRQLLPHALLIPGVFLLAVFFAYGLTSLLPAHSPAPADRGAVLTGLLFLELWAWSLAIPPLVSPFAVPLTRWRRSALTGLAAVGVVAVISQAARSVAALHHNAPVFRAWSYCNAVVYLFTLIFWITRCVSGSPGQTPQNFSSGEPLASSGGPQNA
jgi:hypothetical protein